jgi:magnesium transporter
LEIETVFEALARIRAETPTERLVYFYVTDADDRLVGVAPVRRLLLADPSTLVGELMVHPVYSVGEHESFGVAIGILTAHRLLALPVVDDDGRLTGVLDVSAATGALAELERRESWVKVFQTAGIPVRPRAHILSSALLSLLLALITAGFKDALGRAWEVACLIPLVLVASSAATTWAVSISLDAIHWTNRSRMLASKKPRSAGVAIAVSVVVGTLVCIAVGRTALSIAVACAIAVAVIAGVTLGHYVPRIVHRWELDPEIAAGPIVAGIANIVALTCYLSVSSLVI